MQIKNVARASALVTTLALLALSGSPAMAAEPVARASATGLVLSIAGTGNTSLGTYAVTNDGTKESATGSNQPALSLLGNQNFIAAGTIAQNAVTAISNGDGTSAACSGVAGQGATLAAAGAGNCLSGGNALELTPAQVDLNKILAVQLVAGQGATSLNGLLTALGAGAAVQPVIDALQTQVNTALAPLAGAAVVVGAGAIQSSCTATPTAADGTANIANAGAYIQLPAFAGQPAQRATLLNFPASPPPNTNVVVNLDTVLTTLVDALKTSIAASGQSALAPVITALGPVLGPLLDQVVQGQIINNVVAQIAAQLGPVNQNVLNATLNKQSRSAANQITVTALDLNVLPAIAPFAGGPLVSTQIGTSSCGPNARVAAVAPATVQATKPASPNKNKNNNNPAPKVPTSVPAGLADAPSRNAPLGPWALAGVGALLAASVGAGASAYRRSNARG